jgi:hypothetical protein
LRSAGVDALNKALGPVGTVRFLALFSSEPTDYVECRGDLQASQRKSEGIERKTPPAIRIPRPSEHLYNQLVN